MSAAASKTFIHNTSSLIGDTYFYGGRQGTVDARLKANPVLAAVYALENIPLLYFALSCTIVSIAVKAKLFYDARKTINNATYSKTTQKDMWKKCDVKNVEAYLSRRHVLLQQRFESIGCQIMSAQWNEAASEPVVSSVVIMTIDITNSVIKVSHFVIFKNKKGLIALQSVSITEIVQHTSKNMKTSAMETLVHQYTKTQSI